MQSRRDRGLCNNRGEQPTLGSRCKTRQLFLLVDDELLGIFNWSDRFPELLKFWISRDFPSWKDGSLIKPVLEALGIMFEEDATETRGTIPVSSAIDISLIHYDDDDTYLLRIESKK
ncbi:hypothetical protein NE237_020474 [Protea cynaroides]|uniref:Nematode resistance protein-like HSPRO1 N-terminal domain-containing protein n=1 Tax=Protea cynaroides TaxID=273540 RepID=A0A9Q0HB95_9MAGN|nr:hypothetical protein NE237_020474 [Protea cynaroides]